MIELEYKPITIVTYLNVNKAAVDSVIPLESKYPSIPKLN